MRVLRFIRDTAIDLCLGCRHDRLTRPFTIEDESYMVCLDCGKQLFYSLEDMRRLSRGELRRLRAARATSLTHHATALQSQSSAALPSKSPAMAKSLSLVRKSQNSDRAA